METDLIHRDELRYRAEAWAEDVFAGEPDNCKYNSLMDLIDDSEVVGAADVETEKLIAELRDYFDGKNLNHATAMRAADALERLTSESAEKDAEIERLKEQIAADSQLKSGLDNANALCRTYGQIIASFKDCRDQLQAELDAAVEDLNGTGACFTCKHFRRNGGDCFGAGRCRLDGIEIWPCNEPGVYRVEVPDDGRKTYEWRGPQEAGKGDAE